MMKGYINKIVAGSFLVLSISSCVKDENSPGYEYMPDMYRSPAIEAYVDYGEVRTWIPNDSLKNLQTAKLPPLGTIPYQGKEGVFMPYSRKPDLNMNETHGIRSMEFSSGTQEEYNASIADVSPIAFTNANAKKGEVLYNRFCDHCHGATGQGDGKVSIASDGLIAPPSDAFSRPEGQMFYVITYGKGAMGSHASQLNQKERWELIQYLKVLNNGGEFPANDATTDSINSVVDTLDVNI